MLNRPHWHAAYNRAVDASARHLRLLTETIAAVNSSLDLEEVLGLVASKVADALSVRAGFLSRRRRLVPADAIDQIDGASGVIGLRVEREAIRSFL